MDENLLFFTRLDDETIQFEGENGAWIHIFSIGSVEHPKYGKIDLTPERISRFADNVNNKVRGIDLAFDYSHGHGPDGERAAGWIKKAEARDNGLWTFVEFNAKAVQELKNKEWRYASADFLSKWTDPKGVEHQDVLQGAALTNRPFLKDLTPINFSEIWDGIEQELRDIPQAKRKNLPAEDFAGKNRSFPIEIPEDVSAAAASLGRAGSANFSTDQIKANIIRIAKRKGAAFVAKLPEAWKMEEEGGDLDPKKLAKLLGMPEDTEESKLLDRAKELNEFYASKTSEEERAKKFAEAYPEEAKRMEEQDARIASLTRKNAEKDFSTQLSEWHDKGLPPAIDDNLKAVVLGDAKGEEANTKLVEVFNHLAEHGLVELGERGGSKGGGKSAAAKASDQISELTDTKMKENPKMTYAEASEQVRREHTDLAEQAANEVVPQAV